MSIRAPFRDAKSVCDFGGRTPPICVGNHLALDFLNSTAAPRGRPIEWIKNGRDLLDWLTGVAVLDLAEAGRIAARWSPADLDRVAGEAIDLREWFRGVVARVEVGGPCALGVDDLKRLNGVLMKDATFWQVEPADENGRLRVVARRPWRDPNELLVPIAAAMSELVCEGDFELVRRCENPPCTLWFYDRTKSHHRRWCSQAVCGNRAKVAAHRERKRLSR